MMAGMPDDRDFTLVWHKTTARERLRAAPAAPVDASALIDFVRARLAEDQEVAEREYAYPNGTPRDWGSTAGEADSMLVGMFSPTRVMLEVAAKRAILELHREAPVSPDICRECHDQLPCTTVRLLALPYAQHDDYRQGWNA